MWGRKAPIFLLFQACISVVSVHRGLQGISLSPHETALIDVAEVFSGLFLRYEIKGTAVRQAAVDLNAVSTELTVETQCTGDVHILPAFKDSVVAYSGRRVEVWGTAGSGPTLTSAVTVDHYIEGLSEIGETTRFVYWTKADSSEKREFYVRDVSKHSKTSAQLDGVNSDPGTPVCVSNPYLFTITLQDSPLGARVYKYTIDLDTLQAYLDFSAFVPYEILDMHCGEYPVILTPIGIVKDYGLLVSLEYIRAISGQFIRLLHSGFADQISIETENGLLHFYEPRGVIFIPRGKLIFGANSSYTKALISHNGNLLISLYPHKAAMQSSVIIPLSLKDKASDIREFVPIKKCSLLDQLYLVTATSQGLSWYSLRFLHFPYLKVTTEYENFSFDFCAFNYFDRSDSACVPVHVYALTSTILFQGSPATNSSALHLQCTVTDVPQVCEYDLSEWFAGMNLEFDVQLTDTELRYTAEISAGFESTQFEFLLSEENMQIGCSEGYDLDELTLVLLDGNRLRIMVPSTGAAQEKKAEDGVSLLSCEILRNFILLYGLVNNSLKTLFTTRKSINTSIEKTAFSGFVAEPKLQRSGDALIAILSSEVILFTLDPELVYTLSLESPVLDVTYDSQKLLILLSGRVLLFSPHNNRLIRTDSITIDSKEVAIDVTGDGVVAFDSSGAVTVYYIRTDMAAEALFSIPFSCDFRAIKAFTDCALLVCREAVYSISLTRRAWKRLTLAEESVSVVQISEWKKPVCFISCVQGSCKATVLKRSLASISSTLQLAFSGSQFSSDSLTSSFQLAIASANSAPLSLLVSITFQNPGTFITVVPGAREVEVDWGAEATVPAWAFFRGNEITLSMDTAPAGVSLVQASETVHSVHSNCLYPMVYLVVEELQLVVCYEYKAVSFYQYSCGREECKMKLEATYRAADLGVARLEKVDFLWHYESLVVLSIVATNPAVHGTEYLLILSFRNHLEYDELWNFQYVHNRERKIYVVEESTTKCHVVMYGMFYQHFVLTYTQSHRIEVREVFIPDHAFMNVLSVSSFYKDSQLHLVLLDRERRLFSFSSDDPNSPVVVTHLGGLSLQKYDGFRLQGQVLLHATGRTLNGYALPEFRRLFSISFGISPEAGLYSKRLDTTDTLQPLVTLSWGARYTLVINTSAPQSCSVICSLPYRDVQLGTNSIIGIGRDSFDLIQIHTPALRIGASNSLQESTLSLNLAATNPHSSPAAVSLTVYSVGGRRWRGAALALALCAVGGGLWYVGKRCCGTQREKRAEVEMEVLRAKHST